MGSSFEATRCYKQDNMNSSRTNISCPLDGDYGCMLHFKLHISTYVPIRNATHNVSQILRPDEIIPVSSRCMKVGAYDDCNQASCGHWYTSYNDTKGNFNMHCCCNTSNCNDKMNINLDRCLGDVCDKNSSDYDYQNSCFCPPPSDTVEPDQPNPGPTDLVFVIILCTVVLVIAVTIVAAITCLALKMRNRQGSMRYVSNSTVRNGGPMESSELRHPVPVSSEPATEHTSYERTPLIPISTNPEPAMIDNDDTKFKDYRYYYGGQEFDAPNAKSLCGEGRYGAVHQVINRKTKQTFAMKIFRHKGIPTDDNLTSIRLMWHKEYEHLKLCHHRNIVKRTGAGRFKYDRQSGVLDYAILLEYCPLGSLSSWLDVCASASVYGNGNGEPLTLRQALIIARDIACGLEFLHEAVSNSQTGLRVPVAHRDIKSSNILLRSKDHAVISDFGLAITLNNVPDGGAVATDGNGCSSTTGFNPLDMDVHRLKRCGTPRYLSPELLEGPMDVHNFADAFRQADVYSMSIVQWELFRMCKALNSDFDNRHELPYQAELGTARANIENLQGIVSIGTRPKIPPSFRDSVPGATIYKILIESWDKDPSARITASTVNQRLQGMIERMEHTPSTTSYSETES